MHSLMSLNNLDRSNDDFPIDMRHIADEQKKDMKMQKLIRGRKHEKVIGSNVVDGALAPRSWACSSIRRKKAIIALHRLHQG